MWRDVLLRRLRIRTKEQTPQESSKLSYWTGWCSGSFLHLCSGSARSNLGRNIGEYISLYFSPPSYKCRYSTSCRPRSIPSKSFPIHHSLIEWKVLVHSVNTSLPVYNSSCFGMFQNILRLTTIQMKWHNKNKITFVSFHFYSCKSEDGFTKKSKHVNKKKCSLIKLVDGVKQYIDSVWVAKWGSFSNYLEHWP